MGRLTTVRQRLTSKASRLAPAPASAAERSRQRYKSEPWRAWYHSARWKKLRIEGLKRDGWHCQGAGVALTGRYPAANAPVVDHKIPHRGNADLFWNIDNLQAVARSWHDSTKQSMERRGLI